MLVLFFAAMLALSGAAPAHAAAPVKIVISPWCPYICTDDKARPGVLVEITTAAFASQHAAVNFVDLPWQRQLMSTRDGSADAILGISRSDAPDLLFPRRPTGNFIPCFFVPLSSTWKYGGVNSLRNIRLSVLKGENFNKDVDAYLNGEGAHNGRVDFLSSESYLTQHFQKLAAGRADAVLEEARIAQNYLRSSHQSGRFKLAGCLDATPIWIAFTPSGSSGTAAMAVFEQGLDEIQKSGQLKAILEKYGLDQKSF